MLLSYDVSKMQALLKSFHSLTDIRIVVFSNTLTKIAEYPENDSEFCSLIRQNPLADEKCLVSDRFACEKCKETSNAYSYVCHAGLTETVVPINCGNIVIGYLMFGQVLQCGNQQDYWKSVWERCKQYDIDKRTLAKHFFNKHPVEKKQLYAAAQILEACAGYLWLQRYMSLYDNTLIKQFDEYISENLDADLSVNALCKRFSISRSKLFKIVNEYYGKSVEQLIRELRINRAKELLKNTASPVGDVAFQVGYNDFNYFIRIAFTSSPTHSPFSPKLFS